MARMKVDCKIVRIFTYSSTREQSKAENRERDWGEMLKIRTVHALPISLLILRKKPIVLQSRMKVKATCRFRV